jgi:hypothetical protein
MNKNVLIFGGVALVGVVAYLYFKPKAEAKSETMGADTMGAGTTTVNTSTGTSGGATSGGTTSSLSNTSDGVTPSDANLNLANATVLVGQRAILNATANKSCLGLYDSSLGSGWGIDLNKNREYNSCQSSKLLAKKQLVELDKKLATLGYKVDATDTLVKI